MVEKAETHGWPDRDEIPTVSIFVEPVTKIAKWFLCTLKKRGTYTPSTSALLPPISLSRPETQSKKPWSFTPTPSSFHCQWQNLAEFPKNLSCTRESVRATARRRITLGSKGAELVMLGSCLRSLSPFTPFLVFSVNRKILIKMRRSLLLSSKPQTAEFKMLGLRNKR